jgi:ribosome biogenesis GTPase
MARKPRGASRRTKEPRHRGAVSEENWEQLLDAYGAVSEDSEARRDDAAGDSDGADAAIVISVASGRCRVFRRDVAGGAELEVVVPSEIAVRQKSALAVGDRVTLTSDGGVHRIARILPRHSILARPDPHRRHVQRLIAANVDVVIHVVSVKAPPLRPRLIDRFLIAIQRGGSQPVICVNKIDLLGPEEREAELRRLDVYRDLGIPVVGASTRTGEGLAELRGLVLGKLSALVGHSGVGKSSILNALDERLTLATNTLHRRGTGRHTTTASTLYDCGDDTYLIDTPGIREFGLWDLDRDALRDYFPEFEEPSESCRFTDCTHVHEPDCEVKRRVEEGTLHRARYETYLRLYEDLGAEK